jgi:methyl-accepting chemotaxis protein
MSNGQSKAAGAAEIIDEAHRAFLGIEAAIRNSEAITQQIARASEEQHETLGDVEKMLQGIVAVQQETVEAAEQTHAAGDGIRRTSERLQELIGRLARGRAT